MKKLLKQHSLNSDMQYFEKICSAYTVSRPDAIKLFIAMSKQYRVAFLKAATVGGWNHGLSDQKLSDLFDYALN